MASVLSETKNYKVDTENDAIAWINSERQQALEGGYLITKATYSYKTKKAKGEVIADGYLVTITREYESFWDDLEA